MGLLDAIVGAIVNAHPDNVRQRNANSLMRALGHNPDYAGGGAFLGMGGSVVGQQALPSTLPLIVTLTGDELGTLTPGGVLGLVNGSDVLGVLS